MKKIIVGISLLAVLLLSLTTVNGATPEEIEESITKGIAWLALQQQQVPQVDAGAWRYYPSYSSVYGDIGTTGLVVLKLEDRAKELGLDPFDNNEESETYYEYADNVIAGLNYIFSHTINDTNGVHFAFSETYSTSISLMAISASNAPNRTITTGSLTGETYQTAAQGMMDWLEYAQQKNINFGCDEGGWAYDADPLDQVYWTDQSNTGYAVLGLGFVSAQAPSGFGLIVPGGILDKLSTYIDNVQDPVTGGSWYRPCGMWNMTNILKTGNILHEMAVVGDEVNSTRVQNAISYIENHWNDEGRNPEHSPASLGWKDAYQAMFTMMKGFETYGIQTINVSGIEIDWFDEVSTVIVENQNLSGSWDWINTTLREGEESENLRTAWALLTLERIVPGVVVEKTIYVDIKPSSCPNPINTKKKGVLPVAILGTEEFDITTLDPETIELKLTSESEEGVMPIRWNYEDVATPFEGELCDCHELAGDGYIDMTLKFNAPEVVETLGLTGFQGETIPLTISGTLKEEYGGTQIEGQDCVWVLDDKKK
ncbi:MAG: hypothetical protein KAI55_00085 [Candidatus Aenigmarchaeota archaeon]|nr:hypothetical protein [Candidatus Aenigmarchaeota archaeon]